MLSKADDQHQGATESAGGPSSLRVQDLKSNKDKTPAGDKALALEPGIGSTSAKDIHKHQDLVTIKTDQTQQIGNPSDESPPDELSEAPVQKNAIKSKRFEDQLFPSSTSSLPAIRKNKDEEMMASPSEIAEGDQQVPKPAAARAGAKRRRSEVHKQSERKRRDKITKKMRALQALIPNSSKVDIASMLDQAIEYLKTLELQLQVMSQGTGFCMPPMIVPTGMQHIQMQATNFAHFSTMGLGMAMRMPMGVGCSPAIFSNSAMLGFPARQVLPMPLSLVPFIPFAGWPSTYAVPVSATSGAATPVELMRSGSAPSLSSKDAVIQNINSETSNTRRLKDPKHQFRRHERVPIIKLSSI
ncbi:hypothetical protein GH714_022093 [Hevea brasiliensis]|uniref:BHLH domain-containing protein n=1 Tax=Hevea brasiliensis TaxID=3981 RepID=A0A6A6NIE5_HEVBR|nr:hypothetical protein GH714_022093 [Hevea brasiliensis]